MNGYSSDSGQDLKPIAIIAVVLVVFVAGGAWWLLRRPATPVNATPKAVTATEAPIDKPGAPPVELPPLDQMDAYLRPLLQALSARPEMVKWLATDDLMRQLAFAIDLAAGGDSPSRDLRVIAPKGPFVAAGRGGRRTIDPKSYDRYDSLVLTITSIDATRAAQIYKQIKPRLNEAYQTLGHPTGDVDRAVRQALDIVTATPVVKDPIEIVPGNGARWAYANPKLESLEPSQKQLLRMGPAHVEALLAWLRAFQNAIS